MFLSEVYSDYFKPINVLHIDGGNHNSDDTRDLFHHNYVPFTMYPM